MVYESSLATTEFVELLTLNTTGLETPFRSFASVATAVNKCAPFVGLFQMTWYGLVVVCPIDEPSTKNSTSVTLVLPGVAVALFVIVTGSVNAALLVGLVIATVGAAGGSGLPTLHRPML